MTHKREAPSGDNTRRQQRKTLRSQQQREADEDGTAAGTGARVTWRPKSTARTALCSLLTLVLSRVPLLNLPCSAAPIAAAAFRAGVGRGRAPHLQPGSPSARTEAGFGFRRKVKSPPVRFFLEAVNPEKTSSDVNGKDNNDLPWSGAEMLRLSIFPHAPLGCVVEESLATYEKKEGAGSSTATSAPPPAYVFVSSVKPGGYADQAGLKVGDVIVECSDLFGTLMDATHLGVERVKGLVKSRPDDEPLLLRVARGTRVMQDHEQALVELCLNGEAGLGMDDEMDRCVDAFLKSTYRDDFDPTTKVDVMIDDEGCSVVEGAEVDNTDCLVDDLYSMWAKDLPSPQQQRSPQEPNGGEDSGADDSKTKKKAVKPWSSRSSPSGTFVRDPATGKLKNLDA